MSTTPEKPTEAEQGPRERILKASLKLFVEQGYFNTNVPDISRESRCSVGSIYHHFLNKEEIASQLYRDGILSFREALSSSFSEKDPLETAVRKLVVAFLRFSEDHRQLSQYLWLARHDEFLSNKVTRPTTVGFDRLGRVLTKVIKSGVRKGEMPDLDAEVVWSIIFGIPLSFVRDWLEGFTRQTPAGVAPVIAEACISALKGARTK